MSAVRTFKYRLYPTVAQAAEIERQLAECARLYNGALQERRDAWRMAGKSIGFHEQDAQLKDIRANGDLAIPSFAVARNVLRRVDLAFRAFYRRAKAGKVPGYPRFHSSRRYDSLTYATGRRLHWVIGGRLILNGIGAVRLKLHRPLGGKVVAVTVKHAAGRWYAHINCRVEIAPLPVVRTAIGIDVGLASFAMLSSGETIANPRYLAKGLAALRVSQRRVARRQRSSRNRRKAVQSLQRVHEHVVQQRRDFHHRVARSLVDRFDLIAVEDLNVKGLSRGMLAKSVHDAGWGQFLRLLNEKAENAARTVVAVNPAGTSQQCSSCGAVVRKPLAQRWHSCPCGAELDRDHNAALNILRAGMARAELTWPEVKACVSAEADRPQSTRLATRNEGL